MTRDTKPQSLWGVSRLCETLTVDVRGRGRVKVPVTSPQGGLAGVIPVFRSREQALAFAGDPQHLFELLLPAGGGGTSA
jgi:hypothetical protein